ncbi:NTP transferase domain-containing protein [Candidatus Woesearchaeota archaeon]|nr:NTP transferase domain-containing protein [Candidatus Woesearchaeota archaeon]
MKGVILAGGTGARLSPLTNVTNKHLLPIYNKPMIYYPIETLQSMGLTEVIIISGREHCGHILSLLGSGKGFGMKFAYEIQEEAGGIAQALGLSEDFTDKDNIAVILGDNIFERPFDVSSFNHGAKIFLKRVTDPQRFGVAEIKGDTVIGIEEKPVAPKTDYAVTGLYLYDQTVFSIIKSLKPSKRKELEITDVNNAYVTRGEMQFDFVDGYWTDAGTFESLLRANMLAAGQTLEKILRDLQRP